MKRAQENIKATEKPNKLSTASFQMPCMGSLRLNEAKTPTIAPIAMEMARQIRRKYRVRAGEYGITTPYYHRNRRSGPPQDALIRTCPVSAASSTGRCNTI